MRVVITGGAGFIGANLARTLLEHADVEQVRIVDDLSAGGEDNLAGLDVAIHESALLEPAVLDRAFGGADAVVHLAAHANATATLEVLDAARRAGGLHVVTASSPSRYDTGAESPELAYQRSHGLPVLSLRLFGVYGPLQPPWDADATVIPSFVEAALAGRPLRVHGDGTRILDLTYVETVCRVLTDAVVRAVADPEPVDLTFGDGASLLELIDAIERLVERPVTAEHTSHRAGAETPSRADGSRLRELFPDVGPVGLGEGLERTVEWFRAHRGHSPESLEALVSATLNPGWSAAPQVTGLDLLPKKPRWLGYR